MIYPYRCNTCHSEFTVSLSVDVYDKLRNKIKCPICSSKFTKRTYQPIDIQYKDAGFTKHVKEE